MHYIDGNYQEVFSGRIVGFSAKGKILDIREYSHPSPLYYYEMLAADMLRRPGISAVIIHSAGMTYQRHVHN